MNNEIFDKLDKLYCIWKEKKLGGEFMPEDYNPNLSKSSNENYLYFTLPMALNYQRNSYKLWEGAKNTFEDNTTNFVFNINEVIDSSVSEVKKALTKYKLALQENKQTEIWMKLCFTIKNYFDGDIRLLFKNCDYDVNKIRNFIQVEHKKDFPYLSGNKICNYWLYVLYQYTDLKFCNLDALTVAPDTHILQASVKLGIINKEDLTKNDIQKIVAERFFDILKGSKYRPIDLHTPLWLWSRNGFKEIQ